METGLTAIGAGLAIGLAEQGRELLEQNARR